jgi:uncharacterized protein YidB (DUF937 family)
MSRGFPSMTALLGLLAVAGYQHRDKIAEILGGIGQSTPAGPGQSTSRGAGQSGIGGFLGQLSETLGGTGAGGLLSGGLGELVDRFKQSGHGEAAQSWVGTGPNKPVTPAPARTGDRSRGVRNLVATDRIVPRRAAREAFPRTPRRGR